MSGGAASLPGAAPPALPAQPGAAGAEAAGPCGVGDGVAEQALVFDAAGHTLVGVLSRPLRGAAQATAVVIVVGGPQYRVGSHRQFVELGRAIARAGHVALRFDVSGMGDATGAQRGFETLDDDIAAALAALRRAEPALRGAVLCGLCDGASAALLYLQRRGDPFVHGLALLNPWVRSPLTQAATRVKHYYLERLRSASFWRKLLGGGVGRGAVTEMLASLRAMRGPRRDGAAAGTGLAPDAPYQLRMAAAWTAFAQPVLLLLSGRDLTAREFEEAVAAEPAWRGALDRAALTLHRLPQADHTLSEPSHSRHAEALLCAWLCERHGADAARTVTERTT